MLIQSYTQTLREGEAGRKDRGKRENERKREVKESEKVGGGKRYIYI